MNEIIAVLLAIAAICFVAAIIMGCLKLFFRIIFWPFRLMWRLASFPFRILQH